MIVHKGVVELDQTNQRDVGQPWDQLIQTEVEFVNRGESALVLTGWKAEYKSKTGEWVQAKLLRGSRSRPWDYSYESGQLGSVSIPVKAPFKRALSITIPLGPPHNQMYRRRAIHHSLPNPMEVKFTVSDVNGGSTSIIIPAKSTVANLNLSTKASEQHSNGGTGRTMLGWAQCDDTDAEGRIHASAWYIKRDGNEDSVEIRNSISGSYHTYKLTDLKKIGYNAAKEKKTEVKLDESSKESKPRSAVDTYALVDVVRRRAYGFRFQLKTSTSSATNSFVIKSA